MCICAVVCAAGEREREGEKLQTQSIAENVNASARICVQKQLLREEDRRRTANNFSQIK